MGIAKPITVTVLFCAAPQLASLQFLFALVLVVATTVLTLMVPEGHERPV